MDIRNNFPTMSELEKSIYSDRNSTRSDRLAQFKSPARHEGRLFSFNMTVPTRSIWLEFRITEISLAFMQPSVLTSKLSVLNYRETIRRFSRSGMYRIASPE